MLELLGIGLGSSCVAWTILELVRLWSASRSAAAQAGSAPPLARHVRGFAAWDECGRPVAVEDLGTR